MDGIVSACSTHNGYRSHGSQSTYGAYVADRTESANSSFSDFDVDFMDYACFIEEHCTESVANAADARILRARI